MIPLPPHPDVHGVWVRSLKTDSFGRIGYKATMSGVAGYWCVWEPQGSMGKRAVTTSSFHTAEELVVRPYRPKPWYKEEEDATEG